MKPLLETRKIEKQFGEVIAATNINVKIYPGEILGVIGSNGAGKTTFVNMVSGYLPPSSGEIYFLGKNICNLSPRDLTRIGLCRSFQIPQLFLELTTLDNILIALTIIRHKSPPLLKPAISKELTDEAMELLKKFHIEKYALQKVSTLAQGIRKLIDIVMATAGNPKLLLLDEPTSGVSANEKMRIMEILMKALQLNDIAVLFIEHDMEVVENFAPRVLAFYEGQVLADDLTDAVLENSDVREFVIGTEFHRRGEKNYA